jgi:ABC-type branched-subunit amino acid transport system substrate-binding protein
MKRLPGRRTAVAVSLVGAALCTMGVSRCGTTRSSTVTVTGTTLRIYASVPSTASAADAADILDGERLALSQAGSRVGRFTVRLIELRRKPSDNARTAIKDKRAIAYLGELQPGASAGTMGITNAQDLLQVSPTDTALALTQTTPAVPGAPNDYYEAHGTYGRTFARVAPPGAAEARAQVAMMRRLGVKRLYVAHDGADYGKAIARAVKQDAAAQAISVIQGPATVGGFTSSGSDALFFGASPAGPGASAAAAERAAHLFAGAGPHVKLFAPSALASALLAPGVYVAQPGFLPKDLSSAAKQFAKSFAAQYGHAPAREAIFGYEAMAAVLAVLREAGDHASDRTTVVHDFFGLKRSGSVLGSYSIDSNGDPTTAPFVFSQSRNGTLVPLQFIQAGG